MCEVCRRGAIFSPVPCLESGPTKFFLNFLECRPPRAAAQPLPPIVGYEPRFSHGSRPNFRPVHVSSKCRCHHQDVVCTPENDGAAAPFRPQREDSSLSFISHEENRLETTQRFSFNSIGHGYRLLLCLLTSSGLPPYLTSRANIWLFPVRIAIFVGLSNERLSVNRSAPLMSKSSAASTSLFRMALCSGVSMVF